MFTRHGSKSACSLVSFTGATLLFLALSQSTFAQTAPAFVSSNGNDAGNCVFASPCRTVSYAMTQVQQFGHVLILDSGTYDSSVQLDRSLTIAAAPGVIALFTAAVTNGSIFAVGGGPAFCNQLGVCHSLVLRNLVIDGQGVTQDAVRGVGLRLTIEDCVISRFRLGVYMNGSGTINVKRTTFRDLEQGIYIAPVGSNRTVTGVVENSTFDAMRTNGVNADTNGANTIRLSVFKSSFDRSGTVAVRSSAVSGGGIQFNVEHCHIAGSGTGIMSVSGSSVVRVSNSTIVNNTLGVSAPIGGVLLTRNNNTLEGNNSNGTFSGAFAAE